MLHLFSLAAFLLAAQAPAPAPTIREPKEWITAPAPPPQNRLISDQVGLDVPVGVYGDCSGKAQLGYSGAAVDTCIGGVEYFIGHNPGPFTSTLDLKPGSILTYFDGNGTAHNYRVVSERTWNRFWGPPPPSQSGVAAQLQTCVTVDAVWDRILDAVPD
ncbi:MAG TPA: hypothetical protein VF134_01270 [Candidatus Dormibacteraeota bacterium]